jgi:hypothetical protein
MTPYFIYYEKIFPAGKARPGRDADHSHLVPSSKISRSCTSSPPCRLHGGSGTAFLYFIKKEFITLYSVLRDVLRQ